MKNTNQYYFNDILHTPNKLGRWQSGQLHQTVNLAAEAFGGSNPSLPTYTGSNYDRLFIKYNFICGCSSVGRASAFQAEGREFEPRRPLGKVTKGHPDGIGKPRRQLNIDRNNQIDKIKIPFQLYIGLKPTNWCQPILSAYVAQSVEHVLGKDGVTGSSPVVGSFNN